MFAKKKNSSILIIAVVAILVAAGGMYFMTKQSGGEAGAQDMASAESQPDQVATAAGNNDEADDAVSGKYNGVDVQPGNPVVAKVGDSPIHRNDVVGFIAATPALAKLPPDQAYPIALQQLIDVQVTQNKAEAANIESDPEVQEQLEIAKQQVVRAVFIQRLLDDKISEGKLKKAYNDYVKELPDVEQRHARHILVESEEKANEVIAKLKDGGDFIELAKEYSKDPVAPEGGDLGWFAKADMVPEFAEAAFATKKGDYTTEPVKTQFGWHVLKVEDTRTQPKPSMEEVKPFLRAQLSREAMSDVLADWREKADIETFDINGNPIEPAAGGEEAAPAESN